MTRLLAIALLAAALPATPLHAAAPLLVATEFELIDELFFALERL